MRIVYLFVLILFTINNIYGQSAIKISSEKVKINGETYYAHTVQKQETLYSLSKAYNTTIDAIINQNASAASGLKAGTIIYIPVSTAASGSAATSESTTASAISANAATAVSANASTATATPANASATTAAPANASAAETAPVQKATQVANKKQAKEKKQKGTEQKYEKHTVKWYEDITDISERYGVSVEDILKANNLKSSKLKTRQTLLIPIQNAEQQRGEQNNQQNQQSNQQQNQQLNNQQLEQNNQQENQQLNNQQIEQQNQLQNQLQNQQLDQQLGQQQDAEQVPQPTFRYRNKGEAVEIGYILPLNSVDTNNVSSNFMDFYAGSLLAVNDIKNKDFPITINLYDESEYSPLHKLMDAPGFDKNQLLVGPVRANTIKNFTGYAMQKEIPIVSPLDNGAEGCVEGNPYFIQIPANTLSQIENTIDLLDKCRVRDSVSTVLLFTEKECGGDSIYVNNTKRLLEEKGINYTPISYGILDGREIFTTILASVDTLSPYQHIAIVPSNSEAFVSDVVRNLDLCGKSGAKVTVFGFPKWRNFETINVELLHKMRLHISLPYYVDYNNADVKQFLLQYRALYNAEPTPYAFQGYDITKYILTLMEQYGNSFVKAVQPQMGNTQQETQTEQQTLWVQALQQAQELQSPHQVQKTQVGQQTLKHQAMQGAKMLQSNFQLHRSAPENGVINRATRNIRYNPDYTIEVVEY